MKDRADERIESPWWFHVGLGILVAQQALVVGFVGGNWTLLSFLALVGGAILLVLLAWYRSGVAISGPRGPRSRNLMALRFLIALACIWGASLFDSEIVVVLIALAGLAATTAVGMAYDTALKQDNSTGQAAP